MSLAIATLSIGQRVEFYRRKGKLTSDQRECLNKIFGSIVEEGQMNNQTQAQIIAAIATFIKQIVLGKGNPDYCGIYHTKLDDEYKKIEIDSTTSIKK
jgi:hypothetical protein